MYTLKCIVSCKSWMVLLCCKLGPFFLFSDDAIKDYFYVKKTNTKHWFSSISLSCLWQNITHRNGFAYNMIIVLIDKYGYIH